VSGHKNILIGYSGHAFVVAESYISLNNKIDFYADFRERDSNPFGLKYLGLESDISFKGWDMGLNFILGIGDNILRHRSAQLILSKSQNLVSVIDNNALISKSASLGVGVFASKGVIVNAFSKVGNFAVLNSGCIIEHECVIGAAAHIAPGATLSGNVKVGERTFIGANSVIKQGIEIGKDVIIGAGSVIIENVKSNCKVVGNPGRVIK
jgi:acetyltransferase EpsM